MYPKQPIYSNPCRGGEWGENGSVLHSFGVFVSGETPIFIIFFLKRTVVVSNKDMSNLNRIRADLIPMDGVAYYDLESFYPITPNETVLISPKECYVPWLEIKLTDTQVLAYNSALEKLSERFIFKTI